VVLDKYRYGGIAYRGRADWLGTKRPRIEASDGFDAKKGMTPAARWIDMAGPLPEGRHGGVCFLDHPSNPTYPTPGRIHPHDPYYCFAFAQQGAYTVGAGESLELRYRCVIHDDPPRREASERWARDFADPPTVTIEPFGEGQ
jgi:hypothetical protein